jgi:hypothetical protein
MNSVAQRKLVSEGSAFAKALDYSLKRRAIWDNCSLRAKSGDLNVKAVSVQ